MRKMINEVGHKYGALTVICRVRLITDRTGWLCACDCGGTKAVRGPDLRNNKITSCGCRINSRNKSIIDLTGQQFGYLTVLRRADEHYDIKNKHNVWECRCVCGNIHYVVGGLLKNGNVKSCGCKTALLYSQASVSDLIGQTFGFLTVIDKQPVDDSYRHLCKCVCGRTVLLKTTDLTCGIRKHCGCARRSYGELFIDDFLKNHQIPYQAEYSFPDLLSQKGRKLRYDFAIFDNYKKLIGLIEYDGIQHKQYCNYYGGQAGWEKRQEHDRLKNEYCKNHNIPLLRIDFIRQDKNLEFVLRQFLQQIHAVKVWNE